ncbi:hypothetical protein RHSIM_Rhsim13G0021300 [Rhododendron simsii]|uniref:Uncharacterized protein n=1 Tax=Rhododendron simsii TaxID=118357 RepID=A0A834G191_RHOSS|nr:hypothetical protein RHSIM_Rhsim13G0021300 [Rhododendron simsii]
MFNAGLPLVKDIGELPQDDYGSPGLSHITICWCILAWHEGGMKSTLSSALGSGTLYLAPNSHLEYPGQPQEFPIFANSTFHAPVDEAHQALVELKMNCSLDRVVKRISEGYSSYLFTFTEYFQKRAGSHFLLHRTRGQFDGRLCGMKLRQLVWNTNEDEDLQLLVMISRPPFKVFIYDDWFTPHIAANLMFPIFWDKHCFQAPAKDEL